MSSELFDAEGYLRDLDNWNESMAEAIATADNIALSPAHWEIIHLIRQFYNEFERSPTTRVLLKYLSKHLGPEKASSIYVMTLFPGTPAKTIAKIAGLPKPTNCI